MKKRILPVLCLSALLGACTEAEPPLPLPEAESGIRGEQFGIDRNINESTIDQYLGREDTVYRDMRMLVDEADYSAIGGDAYLSGIVEGFEVVPYPFLCNVEGLPPEVGAGYTGNSLFSHTEDGYTANYEESLAILEYLFPKDRNIILMCGGGGYAGMTKDLLTALGWDEDRIWNAGGYWYYKGDHSISIRREENGEIYYDFHRLVYHPIEFTALHRIQEEPEPAPEETVYPSTIPSITEDGLDEKIRSGDLFALYLYLPGCSTCAQFSPILSEYADAGLLEIRRISMIGLKEDSFLYGEVLYTPTVLLFENGVITARLLPNVDEDIPYYGSTEKLSEWFHIHAGTPMMDGTAEADPEDCDTGCEVHVGE
ncbi:MAG: thioredoxin family protein [Solobacterium sp.]|nr:thioredoxin family protein [Solobacterium sp.]